MVKFLSLINVTVVFAFGGISSTIQTNEISTTNMSPTEINEFLYQRTFSLASEEGSSYYVGTGWLLKHISVSENNYKYYLMTNWHVSDVIPANMRFTYAASSALESNVGDRSRLINGKVDWKSASYFQENNILLGVDASIVQVDFSNKVNSDSALKERLDALNIYSNSHDGYMFNGIKNYNDVNINDRFYVGGYPLRDWSDVRTPAPCHWESGTDTVYKKINRFSSKKYNHGIDDNGKIVSIANGYHTAQYNTSGDNTGPLFKIGGGGSGSMMIDESGNLMGLFWGGYGNTNVYECWFEAFSWNEHNLFDDYLNNMWISIKINKNWWGLISVGITCVCAIGIGTSIYYIMKFKKRKNK